MKIKIKFIIFYNFNKHNHKFIEFIKNYYVKLVNNSLKYNII